MLCSNSYVYLGPTCIQHRRVTGNSIDFMRVLKYYTLMFLLALKSRAFFSLALIGYDVIWYDLNETFDWATDNNTTRHKTFRHYSFERFCSESADQGIELSLVLIGFGGLEP